MMTRRSIPCPAGVKANVIFCISCASKTHHPQSVFPNRYCLSFALFKKMSLPHIIIKEATILDRIRYKLTHLCRCRGISRNTVRTLWKLDPFLEEVYTLSAHQLHLKYKLPMQRARILYADLHNVEIQESIVRDLNHFQVITMNDPDYPPKLKTIPDPPLVLYATGNLALLKSTPAVSVIGTRKPSREAENKTNYIIRPLIKAGWTIVSGMALGIDSFAHALALTEQGETIAVLGSGFNHIYPRQNIKLFNHISEMGLVLSEYPPDVPPARFRFPERNRIISGLSFGTVVIEAAERSGTLITVDQALDQGREVYAVPGSPLLHQTRGCHRLIQDGAKLVMGADDIIDDWENDAILSLD